MSCSGCLREAWQGKVCRLSMGDVSGMVLFTGVVLFYYYLKYVWGLNK